MIKKIQLIILLLFIPLFAQANSKKGIDDLKNEIDKIVSSINCEISIEVVSALKYDVLYSYNERAKMIPASITKVITSAIALKYLGAGYEFKTVLYTDDNDLSDGVINGNLYLKGYGDPEFGSDGINELVKKFTDKNIKTVTGNLIYDESYLDDNYFGLANKYSGETKIQYWPYVNALSFNKNASRTSAALDAANFLKSGLESNNVFIEGITISGVTPESSKEIARKTHPMSDVLTNMNKPSDNHSAITIFKVVGATYGGAPGTLEKGTSAVVEYLSSLGLSRDEYEILEGSGLSRFNFVTSNVYIQILKYLFDQQKIFDIFYYSLPVSGIDGTLKKRMLGSEAEKNVHAKTGSINGVSTLTGYAISRDNEPIIFYIAMNGFKGANWTPYRDKQDYICDAICRFSRK